MRFKLSTFAVAAALTVASPFALAADGGVNSALDRVNAAVSALTATVNQLLTSINQLVAAHNVTPAKVTKLTTSQVQAGGFYVFCNMVNAGATPLTLIARIKNKSGGTIFDQTHTVEPGQGASTSAQIFESFLSETHCEFVGVNNASLVNLRANLTLSTVSRPMMPLITNEAK